MLELELSANPFRDKWADDIGQMMICCIQIIVMNFIWSLMWETNDPVIQNTPFVILCPSFFPPPKNSYCVGAGLGARR